MEQNKTSDTSKPNEKNEVRARCVVPEGTSGQVKKSSSLRKLARIFLTDDPEQAIKNMTQNVFIPNFKKGLVDAFSMMVTGRPAFGNGPFGLSNFLGGFSNTPNTNTPYYMFSNPTQTQPSNSLLGTGPSGFKGSLWFKDYVIAQSVYEEVQRVFATYNRVRLTDLYTAAGISDSDFQQSQYWGWTSLDGMVVYNEGGGFTLRMPPIVNIR